jgi:hypothetical protein
MAVLPRMGVLSAGESTCSRLSVPGRPKTMGAYYWSGGPGGSEIPPLLKNGLTPPGMLLNHIAVVHPLDQDFRQQRRVMTVAP